MTTTTNEYRIETTVQDTAPSSNGNGYVSTGRDFGSDIGSFFVPRHLLDRIKPGAKVTVTVELTPATERVNAFDAARDRRTIGGVEVWGAERGDGGIVRTYNDRGRLVGVDADDMIEVDAL